MPKFIIERNIPDVGRMNAVEMKTACRKSKNAFCELSQRAQWQHSYVTNDKLYCVYIAPNEEAVKEHAEISGFPAHRVEVVQAIVDPTTAE